MMPYHSHGCKVRTHIICSSRASLQALQVSASYAAFTATGIDLAMLCHGVERTVGSSLASQSFHPFSRYSRMSRSRSSSLSTFPQGLALGSATMAKILTMTFRTSDVEVVAGLTADGNFGQNRMSPGCTSRVQRSRFCQCGRS